MGKGAPKLAGLCLLLLAGGCASTPPVPITRYECLQERTLPNGAARALLRLDDRDGKTQEVVQWIHRVRRDVSALVWWEADLPADIDWSSGEVIIHVDFREWKRDGKLLPTGLTLELRTNPAPPWKGRNALVGEVLGRSGREGRFVADWMDVRAMFQGSEELYLVLRNEEEAVETMVLKNADFMPQAAVLEGVLSEARLAAADPENKCEDMRTRPILI